MATTRQLQWEADALIEAPLDRTWAAIDDLSLIPRYHPWVQSVEFSSGSSQRGIGVEYKCIVVTGSRPGWCVYKVTDHIPLQSITVVCTADSQGLSKLIEDLIEEVVVEPTGATRTRVISRGFYTPRGWMATIVNVLGIRRAMRKGARGMLQGLKGFLETKEFA